MGDGDRELWWIGRARVQLEMLECCSSTVGYWMDRRIAQKCPFLVTDRATVVVRYGSTIGWA